MTAFGELVYESSRAFADDEEEEFQNQSALSFEVENTASGKKFLEEGSSIGDVGLCAFVGKVSVGLGDGIISSSSNSFELLSEVKMVGQGDNVVDIYLKSPKTKPVATLYLKKSDDAKSNPTLFAIFNTHGVPRYLANEVVESIESYIKICSRLLIFHSNTMAYYQSSEENCDRKLFYLASSTFPKDSHPVSIPLTPPNVIGGISASLLMHAELSDKPGLLLATFGENEIVDSISLQPFTNFISRSSGNISKMLSPLDQNVSTFLKKLNANPVSIGNLYI